MVSLLVSLLICLVVVAVVCWIVSVIPVPTFVKQIAYAVVGIAVLFYLLDLFGLFSVGAFHGRR